MRAGRGRQRRRTLAGLVAGVLLVTGGLAACSDDDEPDRASSTTDAPSPDDDPASSVAAAADEADGEAAPDPSGDDTTSTVEEEAAEGEAADPGATEPDSADDDDGTADSGDAPAEDPDDAPAPVAPALPLAPTDPAWAATCDAATAVVAQSYSVVSGGSVDPVAFGASLIALLDALPDGVAVEEEAYVRDLVAAYGAGRDLAAFEDDFGTQVEGLMAEVSDGCGVADGVEAIPAEAIDRLQSALF